MKEGDRVRIAKLSKRQRTKVGPAILRVGDVGTIRSVVRDSRRLLSGYIVDCVKLNGAFAWTADFTLDEVEATY